MATLQVCFDLHGALVSSRDFRCSSTDFRKCASFRGFTTNPRLKSVSALQRLPCSVESPLLESSSSQKSVSLRKMMVLLIDRLARIATFPTKLIHIAVRGQQVDKEELPLVYNPDAIAAYFRNRHREVALRVLAIALQCSAFFMSIMLDRSLGKVKENEKVRAAEFLKLITKLGPTAIKIGQALSIRPDMVSSAYLEQLQKLQDRVAPFSTEVAMQLIDEHIGKHVFFKISSEPVAAGSLGQVYKARLSGSRDVVAVKVRRPGVLKTMSCDLFILRQAVFIIHNWFKKETNFVELLDEWASRFFDELDYYKEARNAQRFSMNMSSVPMIVVPEVYMDYTSSQVLTTKWIEGEKLCEVREKEVLSLVKTALTCYLMQLLESGLLHADPHPGNLLRTPDGRLCILDYGLMTEVTEDQQLAMIEYLAHVLNSDYSALAHDLVRLGFLPNQTEDSQSMAIIVPEVARIFTELVRGGGARKVNMQEIANGITKISQDYMLVVPSYFSLIIRAFTLLEGIGLEADPDYAIIRECYPYVAKRLITDDSPRMRKVLKYFLYSENGQLNVKRLEYLVSSFQDFKQLMSVEGNSTAIDNVDGNALNPVTKQVLILMLDSKGCFLQELVLAEFVRLVDAVSRTARVQLWQFFASMFNLPGPPGYMASFTQLTQEDENSLKTLEKLWLLLQPYIFSANSSTALATVARQIAPLVPELFPGASIVTQKFVIMLLQRQSLRFSDELTGTSFALNEWDKDPAALVRKFPWYIFINYQEKK